MNNEINDSSTIKIVQENNEDKKCDSLYKINIIKPVETESPTKNPIKKINKLLFLTPTLKKRETKSPLNKIIDSSLISKKSKLSQYEPEDSKINLLKTKTLKEKSKEKDKNKKKNISKLGKNHVTFGGLSPKRRASVNYNFQINDISPKKNNSIIKLIRYANALYEKDDHLKKDTLTKKIDANNIKRNSGIFMSGRINHLFGKKKLIISFVLKDQNDNSNQNKENVNKMHEIERKITSISRGKSSIELKDKINFSNYLKISPKLKTANKEKDKGKGDLTEKHYRKINDTNIINKNNSNKIYKTNKVGDMTSKSNKFYISRAKTQKTKNNCEKILEERNNNLDKINQKNSLMSSKNKTKKKESINNNKNPTNDFDITKRESPKKEKEDTNKKKKKFRFLCCLNPKDSDSDEIP